MVSKVISTESIAQVAASLKRNPVIWDNIHANDYDQRRLFLGPYDSRSTDLYPMLNGILTNPNCEFEPNFIAMHTLASWYRCAKSKHQKTSGLLAAKAKIESMEAEPEPERESPVVEVMQSESKEDSTELKSSSGSEEVDVAVDDSTQINRRDSGTESGMEVESTNCTEMLDVEAVEEYDLQNSLKNAVKAWLIEFARPVSSACVQAKVISEAAVAQLQKDAEDLARAPIDGGSVETLENDESSPKRRRQQDAMKMRAKMTEDDVSLLVDLFYLPHQHGPRAVELMKEFHWLKKHANVSRGRGNQGHESEQGEGKECSVYGCSHECALYNIYFLVVADRYFV